MQSPFTTLRLPGPFARRRGRGFNPASLFANGEQGAFYDPSDLSTLFQDDAGTSPVTEPGQTVGLVLDKSGNDNHATQPTAEARPVYQAGGGLHWLEFDGVDDFLDLGENAGPQNWTFVSSATPMQATTGSTGDPIYGSNQASDNRAIIYPNDTNLGSGGVRVFVSGNNPIDQEGVDVSGATQVYSIRSASGQHDLRINGVLEEQSVDGVSANILNEGHIAAYSTSTQRAKINIFGLLIVQNRLEGDDLQKAEQFMAQRAGVTI